MDMHHLGGTETILGRRGEVISLILCFSFADSVQVMLEHIYLFQTHDLPIWRPNVYFRCAGEEKRFLTGVTDSHRLYNFTMNESFQVRTTSVSRH